MKTFIFILALFFSQLAFSQDSIKTDRPIIRLQAFPDTTTSIIHGVHSDKKNGIWFDIYALENADPSVKYFIKEKNDNAIIEADPNNKRGFYITPISKKIKKLNHPVIEIEVWVSFDKENVYYPVKKSSDLSFTDRNGKIIEANVVWTNYKNSFKNKDGKILIGVEHIFVR